MINISLVGLFLISMTLTGCTEGKKYSPPVPAADTVTIGPAFVDTISAKTGAILPDLWIPPANSEVAHPDSIVSFARTLIGIPYLYASTDPAMGFDCSGFITYVFNRYNVKVPRSSVDFTHYGKEITMEAARPGDLILFTGTDSSVRIVGHMGIVEQVGDGGLRFIHSTSGKAKGVVITPFERYYQGRFVKIIRVFPDELFP
jgi:cell wall-associated NlpC family hydrolase